MNKGGKVAPMTAGAGGATGRLQKAAAAAKVPKGRK